VEVLQRLRFFEFYDCPVPTGQLLFLGDVLDFCDGELTDAAAEVVILYGKSHT
jgi:hypothetical protein